MRLNSGQLSLVFSCLGHAYMHMFAAFYFVIVVTLKDVWAMPYHELIELWTLGSLLIGLVALPAGWLADRWSAPGMMAIMFIGLGAASILSGLSDGPSALLIGLSAIGVFAAIYHPVGIAWVVRSAKARGKALGINGIFGSVGIAASGVVAGYLIDAAGWRAAFYVPGVVSIATGLALVWCVASGRIVDDGRDETPDEPTSRGDRIRAFGLLMFSMFCIGLVFQATQIGLPEVFDRRIGGFLGGKASDIGEAVAIVYLVAGFTQLIGGWLADRYNVKLIYLAGLFAQVPIMFLIAQTNHPVLILFATTAVFLNASVLPSENMLLARFTPQNRRSLAFGMKFVLAFSSGPLAVQLVSTVEERTGEFTWLFMITGSVLALAFLAASLIPNRRVREKPAAQPAE